MAGKRENWTPCNTQSKFTFDQPQLAAQTKHNRECETRAAAADNLQIEIFLNYLAVGNSNLLPVIAMCEVGIDLAGTRLVRREALGQIIRL